MPTAHVAGLGKTGKHGAAVLNVAPRAASRLWAADTFWVASPLTP